MIHRMRMLDSRSIVRAALFDFLFAAADRHLEHVGAAACNSTLFASIRKHLRWSRGQKVLQSLFRS